MTQRSILAGITGLALAALLFARGSTGSDRLDLVRPPYLQVVTGHSAIVRWRTDQPAASKLRYGAAPGQWVATLGQDEPVTEHEVRIDGLSPATRYYYAVGAGETVLAGGDEGHRFTTAPPRGSKGPVRFWVVGDSGQCGASPDGCVNAGAVRDGYLRLAADRPADFWLMLGDNAYTKGTELQFTQGLFEVYPTVLGTTPLWTTFGNHELYAMKSDPWAAHYFAAFTLPTSGEAGGVPSGTEAYYSFDWGNIHFVSVDSVTEGANYTREGAMYRWLEEDLRRNRADWTILFWHYPPYTKGSHDSDDPGDKGLFEMRQIFTPLIESYGVDLHLSGHSHSYERSRLVDRHYGTSDRCAAGECFVNAGDGDPKGDGPYRKASLGPAPHQGAVYAVVGSSSKLSELHGRHPVMVRTEKILGSLLVDVEGNRLDARFIDNTGAVRDHFQIVKGETAGVGK